jgi:sulfur carrier protein ThiS
MATQRNTGGQMNVVFAPLTEDAKQVKVRRACTMSELLEKAGYPDTDISDIRVNCQEVTSRTVLHAGDFVTVLAKVAGGIR